MVGLEAPGKFVFKDAQTWLKQQGQALVLRHDGENKYLAGSHLRLEGTLSSHLNFAQPLTKDSPPLH
jgi:hypothetical protein